MNSVDGNEIYNINKVRKFNVVLIECFSFNLNRKIEFSLSNNEKKKKKYLNTIRSIDYSIVQKDIICDGNPAVVYIYIHL